MPLPSLSQFRNKPYPADNKTNFLPDTRYMIITFFVIVTMYHNISYIEHFILACPLYFVSWT